MDTRPPRLRSSKSPLNAPLQDVKLGAVEGDSASTPVPEDVEDFLSLGSTRVIEDQPIESKAAQHDDAVLLSDATPGSKPREISVLGGYQLVKKIGQGAMGSVYKARQPGADRWVALKVLYPHIASNPKLVKRLELEGRVMGRLDHPNLVTAFEIGEDQGWHFIAMEYVRGESLQTWIDRLGRLSIGDALIIATECARALEYAHSLGMVHRDIKPDNVLITRQGEVKITDLGMVKTEDEDMSLTQTGHAVGTPWYMPLEQARNAKDTDGRCDIYALGCMLYCMITGRPPFSGKTLVEVIQAKESGTFPAARHYNPEVPERLDLIMIKMTAKLPRYRYQNCTELIADLESLGLANATLTFLSGKPITPGSDPVFTMPPSGSSSDAIDEWFLRVVKPGGRVVAQKLSTAQLRKMLEEGTVDPTAHVSHQEKEGFRVIATYKQFRSVALIKQSRKSTEQQASRYRHLYREIEEKDRIREQAAEDAIPEPIADYSGLWIPALLIAAGFVLLVMIWYFLANLV